MNIEQFEKLGNIFAKESFGVIVNPELDTAAFDLKNRILYLPNWEIDDSLFCMLIAHESAHAIWTPPDALGDAPPILKQIYNIVEDYRIDILIKKKYPGLVLDYKYAINHMLSQGFFGDEETLNKYKTNIGPSSFLNRLVLYLKITQNDHSYKINFSKEELPLVKESISCKTFDDVVEVSKKILDYVKDALDEESKKLIEKFLSGEELTEQEQKQLNKMLKQELSELEKQYQKNLKKNLKTDDKQDVKRLEEYSEKVAVVSCKEVFSTKKVR